LDAVTLVLAAGILITADSVFDANGLTYTGWAIVLSCSRPEPAPEI
jgi:hypothetical protein